MKHTRKIALLLVLTMLVTIPNMKVYSAVGTYQTSSGALTANTNYSLSQSTSDTAFWPAVLAVAAGVGLAVVGAVGVLDGWNSHHAETSLALHNFESSYNSHDFQKFDN